MLDPLLLSRVQFGMTAGFHILWPLLSIGISLYMVVMEALYLKTKDVMYFRQVRFWSKLFLITFAVGIASGIPLEFQFGTNWAAFSKSAGDFFGNTLGFEATVAFMLESAFLAVFAFGWKRVKPAWHFFSNIMVFVGASLSAFWIMAANSWMQTPAGVTVKNGMITVTNYAQAIFNPTTMISFTHMWLACVETSMFLIAAVCAWHLLRKRPEPGFWLSAFKVAVAIVLVVSVAQVFSGDASARAVSQYQPAKAAAMEAHWNTNPNGTSAAWNIIAFPDAAKGTNDFQLQIPYMLSILTNHSLTSSVTGLNSIPANDRPPVAIPFWSFRVMVLCGMLMVLLAVWATAAWLRKRLSPERYSKQRWLWTAFIWSWPLGFIATEAGWMVREIGRQPWIVTGIVRTSQGVTKNLSGAFVLATLIGFAVFYLVCLVLSIYFGVRVVKKGPDFTELPKVPV